MSSNGTALRQTNDWDGDIAYGDDENRFTISRITGDTLTHGMMWQIDGTPYAGIIDTVCPSVDVNGVTSVSYKGRTIQGMLAAKVLMPPSGQTHLVANGDLNTCIGQIIEVCGLESVIQADPDPAGATISNYRYRRFVNAYDGLRMMLQEAGYRLEIMCTGNGIVASAKSYDVYGDIPSELVAFNSERTYRPVNHMIGLGEGQGTARQISQWYADAQGNLSQTQTMFGVDEVAQTMNIPSSDNLSVDTKFKLNELQTQGTLKVTLPAGLDLDVGDFITASDSKTGLSVESQVTKVAVSVTNGIPTINYTTGTPQWPDEED